MLALSEESPLRSVFLSLNINGTSVRDNKVAIAVLLSLAAGVLLSGYLCFAVGAVFAFEATRATVRIICGYRWEWMRFLKNEIHRSYRVCRVVPRTRAIAVALRHPLTGHIDGYYVEYTYCYPCDNSRNNTTRQTQTQKKKQERPTSWIDFRRVIVSGNGGRHANPSASCYNMEAVRSIAEHIQRESPPDDQQRMENTSDQSSSDDNIRTSDESCSSDSDEGSTSTENNALETTNATSDDQELRSRRKPTRRRSTAPSVRQPIDSFLVPIDRWNPGNKAKLELGVPLGYWTQRRTELLTWAEIVEPAIAFFGMNFYLAGCLLHAVLTCPPDTPVGSQTRTRTLRSRTDHVHVHVHEHDDFRCYHHVRNAMHVAVVAIILMVPYCILEARVIQRKNIQFWRRGGDPLASGSGGSELDRLRNTFRYVLRLGRDSFPSTSRHAFRRRRDSGDELLLDHSWKHYARKESLYAPSFAVGTLLLCWECGLMTLLWAYAAVYCMVQWIHPSAPIQREILERFKVDPYVVSNVPATATAVSNAASRKGFRKEGWVQRLRASVNPKARNCFVELRYAVPVARGRTRQDSKWGEADSGTVVIKNIQSEELCRQCEANPASTSVVSVLVDPNFPLSGYPTADLDRDISNSWSLKQWQAACFVTIWCFLFSACSAIDIADNYGDDAFAVDKRVEDLCTDAIWILTGFGLLLPGASMLRQTEHDRFLVNILYEPTGSVIQAGAEDEE